MTRIIAAAAVAVALIGGAVWWFAFSGGSAANAQQASTAVSDASDTSAEFGVTEMVKGNPDATVEVIEYASYTCPHCATFHTSVLPDLEENYIDTGKIRFVYREVYFDKYGMWASLIARCGGEEKFFGITDLLYKSQRDWSRAGDDAAIADELRKIGRIAGIDSAALDACLTDGDQLQALLGWFQANAEAHEINSTPSFVINGRKYSNMPFNDFATVLDEQLGE